MSTRNKNLLSGLAWLLIRMLSGLPGFFLKGIAGLVYLVVHNLAGYRGDIVLSNLEKSLPGMDTVERTRVIRRFYRHFAELFPEMALFTRLRPKPGQDRIRLINPELLQEAHSLGKNVIVMAGHFGNWEWNLIPMISSGYRAIAVYKPQNSRFADRLMALIRSKPGITLITMKETMRKVKEEIGTENQPFALLLVADQIPAKPDIRFWTTFLGQDTAFFTGGEKLSRKFGLPVYYFDQEKTGFGRYRVRCELLHDGAEPPEEGDITRRFAAALEASIRRDPGLWLWTHRRWKYPRQEVN